MEINMLQHDLQSLFERDLNQLIKNIEATTQDKLWKVPAGIMNSVGVLTQHLVGNLNHYIGKGIGDTGYIRQRDLEFTDTGASKEKLIEEVEAFKSTLAKIFVDMDRTQLSEAYPMESPFDMSTQKMLMHLYGHLNYHLGQVNYLRRMFISSDG